MTSKGSLQGLGHRVGVKMTRWPPRTGWRRQLLLRWLGVDVSFDRQMNPAVFICGCGHSGSSLLAAMFAAHDEVYVPQYETETFLMDEPMARERYRNLVLAVRAAGKNWLVEKTPRHVRHLQRIRAVVPGAKFLISVRDGRDVVASMMRRFKNVATDELEALGAGGSPAAARRWIQDNKIVLAERDKPDVWVYRHEDLIENPRRIVEAACVFSGIPFQEAMLHYYDSERLWFGQKRIERGTGIGEHEHLKLRNWQINQPIFDSRGGWESEISAEDLSPLVSGPGREIMEAFGYSRESDGAGAPRSG